MKKVAVGSTNPVKINSVAIAFEKAFPEEEWEVLGVEVPSGVANQPMSDVESIRGARNRAKIALEKLSADFGVGLEGGLQEIDGMWFEQGWMVVLDTHGTEGVGSTVRTKLGKKVMDLVLSGKELGEATDIIFGAENSKQNQGYFGLITNNRISRTSGYSDGVIMALTPFLHPEMF